MRQSSTNITNLFLSTCLMVIILILGSCSKRKTIDYSLDVKPILNNRCIACHGGVRKQGGFSLLFESEALALLKSGKHGIVPGSPSKSEMIQRLNHHDPELRMPFEADPLPQNEIDILTTWIRQGAKWGKHWAYQSLQETPIPNNDTLTHKNAIDAFIHEKLIEIALSPSAKATPRTLTRRLGLDIIGTPTTSKEALAYIDNPSDSNYENLVDHLLSSDRYGEKWTSMWLDLARYADTKGYERDDSRTIWRYRDWLIKAFNNDMPYDQFIVEQLAGDLLPNPTDDNYIATAFHRNTMTNDEGGTDNDEFRNAAVIDRVNTTWESLMSTSFACVQCHSHPYDPFTHEEYYKFFSFFNNTRDEDTFDDYPTLRHYNASQKTKLENLVTWVSKENSTNQGVEIRTFLRTFSPAINSLTADMFINASLADTKWLNLRNGASARLKNVNLTDRTQLLFRHRRAKKGGHVQFHLDQLDGPIIGNIILNENGDWDWEQKEIDLIHTKGTHDIYLTYDNERIIDPDETGIAFDWFYFHQELPENTNSNKENFIEDYWQLINADVESTPIMVQNPNYLKRKTNVFERGNWLARGKEVYNQTPQHLPPMDSTLPNNRLGLAKWMTSPEHPLTARTIVNRLWEQIFGIGLVETLEDIGSQGAAPSHKELLDYLSWQLIHEYDWSIKRLIKEIVLSNTYRQRSNVNNEHLEKDPLNRYLARMSRVRLTGEQVRDQALTVAGELNDSLYGPPVMPYQPEGIWSSPYDNKHWEQAQGKNAYRRAVYTYWKRTSPYPSMITFDGVGREVCTSRRIRTNTPLQALVTLNDEVYIDLSKKLVALVWETSPSNMIQKAYQKVTNQIISEERHDILLELYNESLNTYKNNKSLTKAMCKDIKTSDPSMFAAMSLVANAILNLDEVISKT